MLPVSEGYAQPGAQGIRVDNPGLADAVIERVSLSGKDAEHFILSREEGGLISAGARDARSWTVRPAAGLEKAAILPPSFSRWTAETWWSLKSASV